MFTLAAGCLILAALLCMPVVARAQQAAVQVGLSGVSDGFVEQIGTAWGVSGPNFFFRMGGGPAAFPAAAANPAAGANFGFGFGGGGLSGGIHVTAGQGSSRVFSSRSISGTFTDGNPAFIADVSLSPFVISVVPIVGQGQWQPAWLGQLATAPDVDLANPPVGQNAGLLPPDLTNGKTLSIRDVVHRDAPSEEFSRKLARAKQSSAGRASAGVAAAERQRAARQQAAQAAAESELDEYLGKARRFEADDNPDLARIYYRLAQRRATGRLKVELAEKLVTLNADR